MDVCISLFISSRPFHERAYAKKILKTEYRSDPFNLDREKFSKCERHVAYVQ